MGRINVEITRQKTMKFCSCFTSENKMDGGYWLCRYFATIVDIKYF